MPESKMYTASVIADSISKAGNRITSVKVVYPHAVHKDMLRHRIMNRNVESFRAQPPEVLIENLRNGHAFRPEVFAERTRGMGQGATAISEAEKAALMWDAHRDNALHLAEEYLRMNIAKQQVNFVLQDLCPLTEIITATDWSNFYALRTELRGDGTPVARPEVYKTAVAIRDAIEASTPQELEDHWLHLPMLGNADLEELCRRRELYPPGSYEVGDYWVYVSAGRCARVSFGDYRWWEEPREKSYERAVRLLQAGHMSPFEQQAKPFSPERWEAIDQMWQIIMSSNLPDVEVFEVHRQLEYSGNLHGWVPARKTFPKEWDYGELKRRVEA